SARIDLVSTGQLLTLHSPQGTCVTRVLENDPDRFTVVGAPRVETPPDFAVGLRVRVVIKGVDALYNFPSRLLHLRPQPFAQWELQRPRIIRREQRRKPPRLSVRFAVRLSAAATENGEPILNSVTEDVSLGGFALVAEQPLPIGATVHYRLQSATL